MSRAFAYIRTPQGEHVAHGLYNGSVDILMPGLTEEPGQAWDLDNGLWERPDGLNPYDVVCEHEPEVGYAYSGYGGGSYWPVRFCRECMIVLGPRAPWVVFEGSDAPDHWLGEWPKDGEPPIEASAQDVERLLLAP